MSASNPRAQIPGYSGYIPGKDSQNKFGASFGHLTKGAYDNHKEAFLTTNHYPEGDTFWSKSNNLSVLQSSGGKELFARQKNKKAIHVEYEPKKITNLTYQEAINNKNI